MHTLINGKIMKKFTTLLLAAGLVFSSVTGAFAVDFKAKGEWFMSFDYGAGFLGASSVNGFGVTGYGDSRTDKFNANQRIRLQLEAIASESLSGTVIFEMGESTWGSNANGAALGADQAIIEVKHAYIDWVIPNTELKVRMGIQGIALPSYTTEGSMVFNNDVAGIVLSNKFNDNISLTAFWARPYNDNYRNEWTSNAGRPPLAHLITDPSNYLDNVDMFGLVLPLSYEGFAITPWLTYASVGRNAFRQGANTASRVISFNGGNSHIVALNALLPIHGISAMTSVLSQYTAGLKDYGDVWNVGLTGEITATDPLRVAWDINYGYADFGSVNTPLPLFPSGAATAVREFQVKREGFYVSLLAEYAMDFGIPGIYAWYSSGDDDDAFNGSERMPSFGNLNSHVGFSNYALSGNPYIAREGVLGQTLIGTWGLGVRIKDVSFMEDLKHTFRINYFNGTNSTAMTKYMGRGAGSGFTSVGGKYLTTRDNAWEFGLSTNYEIYENLNMYIEAAYLVLNFDQSNDVWGGQFKASDAYNLNVTFAYTF